MIVTSSQLIQSEDGKNSGSYGAAWLNIALMVRRGSVGSASACWKAGTSSILGAAPQGVLSH
jgi:hypothetical protein